MKTIIRPTPQPRTQLKQVIEKKELIFMLSKREIFLRFRYKFIGLIWGVAQPLLLALIISQSLGKTAEHVLSTSYYFLSVFIGYVFWMYFSSTVGKASSSLVMNRSLIQNASFPHIILPLSMLEVGGIDFVVSLFVGIAIAYFLGFPVYLFPVFFLCVVIMVVTTCGIGALFAALYARFSDIRELLSFSITVLFFLTPIIYPVKIIPASYHKYLFINPMAGAIETAKATLFSPSSISWDGLFISTLSSIFIFLLGVFIFQKIDKTIVDIL